LHFLFLAFSISCIFLFTYRLSSYLYIIKPQGEDGETLADRICGKGEMMQVVIEGDAKKKQVIVTKQKPLKAASISIVVASKAVVSAFADTPCTSAPISFPLQSGWAEDNSALSSASSSSSEIATATPSPPSSQLMVSIAGDASKTTSAAEDAAEAAAKTATATVATSTSPNLSSGSNSPAPIHPTRPPAISLLPLPLVPSNKLARQFVLTGLDGVEVTSLDVTAHGCYLLAGMVSPA